MRAKIHLRKDDGESYCGLRLLPDARLTDIPGRAACHLCHAAYTSDGHPTPKISDMQTPIVDVEGALDAQRELARYLREIRDHDERHKFDADGDKMLTLPKGVKATDS